MHQFKKLKKAHLCPNLQCWPLCLHQPPPPPFSTLCVYEEHLDQCFIVKINKHILGFYQLTFTNIL